MSSLLLAAATRDSGGCQEKSERVEVVVFEYSCHRAKLGFLRVGADFLQEAVVSPLRDRGGVGASGFVRGAFDRRTRFVVEVVRFLRGTVGAWCSSDLGVVELEGEGVLEVWRFLLRVVVEGHAVDPPRLPRRRLCEKTTRVRGGFEVRAKVYARSFHSKTRGLFGRRAEQRDVTVREPQVVCDLLWETTARSWLFGWREEKEANPEQSALFARYLRRLRRLRRVWGEWRRSDRGYLLLGWEERSRLERGESFGGVGRAGWLVQKHRRKGFFLDERKGGAKAEADSTSQHQSHDRDLGAKAQTTSTHPKKRGSPLLLKSVDGRRSRSRGSG